MKATCSNNPEHQIFITTAHVMQDWKVDEHGNFLEEVGNLETTHEPDPDNCWTCAVCGADAKVTMD